MGRLTNGTLTFALAALVGLCWPATDAAARMVSRWGGEPLRRPGTSSFEFVLEGGLAEPLGEHRESFGTEGGLDAGTGYELGLRLRQHLGGGLALAPTFHYVQFGESRGVGEFPEGDGLAYELNTSLLRYGVDLQMLLGADRDPARLVLTGGIGLAHNRYRDSLQGYQDFETSMNGPSWNAGIGVKLRVLELSAAYVWNRFDTRNLSADGVARDHDWDYAVVRLGFAFGAR